jgi:glycosyltransferase involved in cell wall biosynthesis
MMDQLTTVIEKLNIYLRFISDENFGGPARPRNRGIALARSPLVAFLDSDDWWTPEKLTNSMKAMEAGADLVYHDLYIVRSNEQQTFSEKIRSSVPRYPLFKTMLCSGFSIPNSSVVVRKNLLEKIGGFSEDTELISVEDLDSWLRISHYTERFKRLNSCDGYYWYGGGNISTPSELQEVRINALYSRHLNDLAPTYRAAANGFLSYRLGRLAEQCGNFDKSTNRLLEALASPIPISNRLKALFFIIRNFVRKIQS